MGAQQENHTITLTADQFIPVGQLALERAEKLELRIEELEANLAERLDKVEEDWQDILEELSHNEFRQGVSG